VFYGPGWLQVKARAAHFIHLRRPYAFKSPFDGAAFAALLVVADPAIKGEERALVAKQLVNEGCRYAMCAGFDCAAWEEEIDWVHVMAEANGEQTRGLVMTTSHTDEPLEETVGFFWNCVSIDDAPPERRAAVLLGDDATQFDALREAVLVQ